MFLWWGPELIQIYNDAYVPSFGVGKHPAAMGQRGADCWQEIWPIIWPQIEAVMTQARASWNEDHLVPIFRNDRIEEVYWTYSYSPVFDDDGSIGGTLVVCTETTARVVSERRLRALAALADTLARAPDGEPLLRQAASVFTQSPQDVPFALLYVPPSERGQRELIESAGLSDADVRRLLSDEVAIDARMRRLRAAADSGEPLRIAGVRPVGGSWPEPVEQLFVAALRKQPDQEPSGFLLLGLSPRLPFDASYRQYIAQITDQLASALARIDAQRIRAAIVAERNNLLLQAPVAISIVTGPEHVYELANAAYQNMVGEERVLIGRRLVDVFPEVAGSELVGMLDRIYASGEPFRMEEMPVQLTGSQDQLEEIFFNFNIQPLRDAAGSVYGMMTLAMDVSDMVRSRRSLERSAAEREKLLTQLEAASRAKDEFLAMLGHELRNPLSPIVTALDLKRLRDGGALRREDVMIERQVKHLVRLVDDLLDVARITRGTIELRRETVDIASVVQKAVEISSVLYAERGHALEIDVPEGIRWFGDATRLAQVIANLLTNAARYTPPGGHVKLSAACAGGELSIRVQDDGIGIAPELMQHIFEPFFQGTRSADRSQGGLGIGLALVKNLVAMHQGSVACESAGPGRGSTFTLRLPTSGADAASGAARPQPSPAPRTVQPRRILVVDDNADAGELLGRALRHAGHEVVIADSAELALERVGNLDPDVAVLDIGLPDMDGYALAARIKSVLAGKRVRLIALTGYGQEQDRRRSEAAGFVRHLVKPVDLAQLLELVSTC